MHSVLGIDTSNYTTSLCAVSLEDGKILGDARKVLPVPVGQRGLRQSEALFFHVQQLSQVMFELKRQIRAATGKEVTWSAVGCSVRPRPSASSYMPVFQAGVSFANTFGHALGCPVIHTSHQEGHLAAAEYFLDPDAQEPFLGVHLSGGTTDVLYAKPTRWGYQVTPLAEGKDLHAGQFVDRVGVALGCTFPAGPQLERLALEANPESELRLNSSVDGMAVSFSGPCSAALRAIEQGVRPADVARAVEDCIANSIVKALTRAWTASPKVTKSIVAGGVAANAHIRQRIVHRMGKQAPQLTIAFAPQRYSSDNALGVASITRRFILG